MVPCCPTTQHTVLLGAWPARRRAFTPLSCCCQLFPSIERKIVPESPSAQYIERSGEGISTAGVVIAEAVGVLALSAVACAAEARLAALAVCG